jgi:hypothetical protein
LHPLIPETETFRSALPAMLASYDADNNLPSRRWGATSLFKKAIAQNPELRDELIAGMAKSVNELKLREGFKQPIDRNNIFETLRYIDMKKHPENAIPLLPAIERIYPTMATLPASWTIIGARWGNIGLAKAAEKLGDEGKPFIASMKRIQPNLEARCAKKDKQSATLQKALDTLTKTVEGWEAEFGKTN